MTRSGEHIFLLFFASKESPEELKKMQNLLEVGKDERPVYVEGDYLETMGRFLELESEKPPRSVKIDAADIHELLSILESSQNSGEQLIQVMEALTQKFVEANVFLDVIDFEPPVDDGNRPVPDA